jgi:hypothetical protein
VVAQHSGRPEAHFPCYVFYGSIRRLEQALRAGHARASDPGSRRGADLLTKASAERAGAHRRAPSKDRHGEVRREQPTRRTFNATFLAGAMGAYISGGLGLWELPFAVIGSIVAYRGLRSYRFLGVGWLMHSTWDLVHHFFGNPIWPFLETSSFGCFLFDAVVAAWFFVGAPSVCGKRGSGSRVPASSRETLSATKAADAAHAVLSTSRHIRPNSRGPGPV